MKIKISFGAWRRVRMRKMATYKVELITNTIVRHGCQMRPRPTFSQHHHLQIGKGTKTCRCKVYYQSFLLALSSASAENNYKDSSMSPLLTNIFLKIIFSTNNLATSPLIQIKFNIFWKLPSPSPSTALMKLDKSIRGKLSTECMAPLGVWTLRKMVNLHRGNQIEGYCGAIVSYWWWC